MYFANNMGEWYDTGEIKCNQSIISDLALPGVLLQMLQFGSNKTATAAAKSLQSCPTLATLWTAVYQAPLSIFQNWESGRAENPEKEGWDGRVYV